MKSLRNLLVAGSLGLALAVGCGGRRQDAETIERAKLIEQVENGMKSDYLDVYSFNMDGKFIMAYMFKDSSSPLKYSIVNDGLCVKVYSNSKVEIESNLDKIEDQRLHPYALKFGDKVLRGILLEQEKERNDAKVRYEKAKEVFGAKF